MRCCVGQILFLSFACYTMHYMQQPVSFRWSQELIRRVDAVRGDVPRSRWVRRVVEQALGDGPQGVAYPPVRNETASAAVGRPASVRQSVPKKVERAREVLAQEGPAPPKIAPRHWA